MILTKKAKLISNVGVILNFINFLTMFYLMFRNRTIAFPGGGKDEQGYFTIDHGKRYDFSEIDFLISYWQAAFTFGWLVIFILIVIPTLYATGDIKSRE